MTKPKILIIENSVDVTGALKSITRTAFDLSSFFQFNFVIPKGSKGKYWIENKGFSTIELPMRELAKRLSAVFFYLPYLVINAVRLNRIAEEQQVNLIHVNDIYNLLPVVIRLLGNSTPYVCHIRFLPDRFPSYLLNFWLKLHFRFAARIVVVSNIVKQQLPANPKIIVIHDQLPTDEQYPGSPVISSSKGSYTFLYLANFIEGKGQQFALEAFSKIHSAIPNWKLRFIGGDMGLEKNRKYRDNLKSIARELAISHRVEWMEFSDDVEKELKQADVVLNFSESESFSLTCLEALYFGRPLIATDCGGPAEIIDHMETGILVPNRNVQSMAEAMILMVADEHLRNNMATKARTVVKERFSIEKTSMKLKDVYDKILKSRKQINISFALLLFNATLYQQLV